jgi:tRNA-dihydrouridine synthase B
VHGRTRACGYRGDAEYDTIAEIKSRLRIPVVANGDIDTPAKAARVLALTGADAVMIGRAAQGNPWIFGDIVEFLATGRLRPAPGADEFATVLRGHLLDHYAFQGEDRGVRTARKHVGWYLSGRAGAREFLDRFNRLESADEQLDAIAAFAGSGIDLHDAAPACDRRLAA